MKRDARLVLTELLVLAAQGGDEDAFSQLHQLWCADLHRLALIRAKAAGPAEEIAQDAWVTITRSLARLDDPACFPRWALRIVERRCADWLRRIQADRRRAEAVANEALEAVQPARPEERDDIAVLREAIAQLPAPARELLHLYYELGLSVFEVAEVLGVPPGTVKSRLYELRETLKRQIERITS